MKVGDLVKMDNLSSAWDSQMGIILKILGSFDEPMAYVHWTLDENRWHENWVSMDDMVVVEK